MVTRKTDEKPEFKVPPPMEEGDKRTVPAVGGDPENPESDVDINENTEDTEDTEYAHPSGKHIDLPEGWTQSDDGGMEPETIPWVGY